MNLQASQKAFAQALTDPDMPLPCGVTSKRGEPDATRFAVYRNNVAVGLISALEKRFPVTARLVGVEFFVGMARDYIRSQLPTSPLMFEYGDSLPDFIAGYDAATSVAYLADVARVEAAWTDAYHARDAAALCVADLAGIEPETLGAMRLAPHPSAALIRSRFPSGSIWAAHQGEAVATLSAWHDETVLVARPHMAVTVNILPPRDAPFAEALIAGATLAEAAAVALGGDRDFDFGSALVGLVSLGAFCARSQPGEQIR